MYKRQVDATTGEADAILRRTLNMEEVRNDLGTEALYLLSNNFAEQDSSLSKCRASTLKRHELVILLLEIHTILHSFLSEPSRECSNALANYIAEARCLISSATLNTDQQSQCMQKFAEIGEMCKRSGAAEVIFKTEFESFKKHIQEIAVMSVERCHAFGSVAAAPLDEKRIWENNLSLEAAGAVVGQASP